MSRHDQTVTAAWRVNLVRISFALIAIGLLWRLADIQIFNNEFLRFQGDARHIRSVPVVAHRGMILDRHGEPLAISTPVHSVWVNPRVISDDEPRLSELAALLGVELSTIQQRLRQNQQREFMYVKRRILPEEAESVRELRIPGVALQREYKRYYPTAEVTAHVLGFTNIDDVGQEGIELTYDPILTGVPGLRRMLRDSRGNFVGGGEQIRAAKAGENLQLSIDMRLQYLTYNALREAVRQHGAEAGTAVILDVDTGEVLAMVNQPAFNPNNRVGLKSSDFRNRAVTDLFEPGSTVKPFTVVSGLKSGLYNEQSIINTHPGTFRVGRHTIRDFRDYGEITLGTLIEKSSNIASSKIALAVEPEDLWNDFANFGLASDTGAYFPGEAVGHLPDPRSWRTLDRATLAYGYGLATNALQLARAYSVIGNGGILRDVSFIKQEAALPGRRVFDHDVMNSVRGMMELTVRPGGTGTRAAVPNYRVAGKTGTVKKATAGGYTEAEYQSVFAGLIPATNPKLAMVVMIDTPRGDEYYGGAVAAPVFAQAMSGAMRLMNIAPDGLPTTQLQVAAQ